MRLEIETSFSFEAAYEVSDSVRGNSFQGRAVVRGQPDEATGFIIDLRTFDQRIADVIAPLDHVLLNDVEGLSSPTLERIAAWIFERLAKVVSGLHSIEVSRAMTGERARAVAA